MGKKNQWTSFILIVCLIVGMLLGRIVSSYWNREVKKEVKEVLDRVVMIDVPAIDVAVSEYLFENEYEFKYLTAIDISTGQYGIYEIAKDNSVKAYAHGECVSTGDASPGIYEIQRTKSHVDYHDVRYWRVVELSEVDTDEELIVSSSGYEIDDAPIKKISDTGSFGNVMIDSDVMLTVYDNSMQGIILIVIDSKSNGNNARDLKKMGEAANEDY